MELPSEYIILRQPAKIAEVVFVKNGIESILFSGGRVKAKHFLDQLKKSIPYESVRTFNLKKGGKTIVETYLQ